MNALPFQPTTARATRVRAALARMTDGAVLELPTNDLRERFMRPSKVIAWRHGDGSIDLRTWDESSHKEMARWSLDADGRLLDDGVATVWFAYDLRPTGENAIEYIIQALPDDEDDLVTHGRVVPLRRASEVAL
jgi:hypothetical protein